MPRYRGSRGGGASVAADRPRVGVLLSNLGTPDDPSPGALRRFLREFLSDPRVVELSPLLWWPILHLFILPVRPFRISRLYRSIWTDDGSPMLHLTRSLGLKVEAELATTGAIPVVVGMRYGKPSMADALDALISQGCGRIVHLPLYPQYSASTTATNVDALNVAAARYRWLPEIRHRMSYHLHPLYIEALAESIRSAGGEFGGRRLLLSFHGIPQRYADQGDPYPIHCRQTAAALAEELGLASGHWKMAYQSRFGRDPWLEPSTKDTLQDWGECGAEGVDVVCPGFAVDCLETLEEIEVQNRKVFTEAGGRGFRYLPALNDADDHARLLARLALEEMQGWGGDPSEEAKSE